MPRKKTRREDGRPRKEGWSDWSVAMVPFDLGYNVKNRAGDNDGYIVRDIERAFPDEARRCVISTNGRLKSQEEDLLSFTLEAHAGPSREHSAPELTNIAEMDHTKPC